MAKKPSEMQKKAIQNYIDNGGNASKAMRDAGYASTTIENPSNLTRSDAFISLVSQIPESLLVDKHLALLNKMEVVPRHNRDTNETEYVPTGEIDAQSVAKGLDMAYKIRGTYAPEKKEVTGTIIVRPTRQDEELAHQINEIRKRNTRANIEGDGGDAEPLG